MAELTPLYMDIDNVYSGDELGLPWRDIIGEGIVGANDLKVTQHAGAANLSVDVAAGAAWVLGDTNPDAQPCYRVRNDAVVNLGITPDPSNPRKVIVVAQITDETFAGTGRQWALVAIHGTPAGSPSEPALPASALKLAVITVPAAAGSIVTADIADSRVLASVGGGAISGSGGGTDHGLVTTLPSSPSDGDTCTLTDSLTAPTFTWHLRYVAAKASNKWVCIGGPAKYAEVTTDESTTSASYAALTTAGPSVAVPVAGDYFVDIGADNGSTAGAGAVDTKMSYDIGGTAAVDADAIVVGARFGDYPSAMRRRKKTGLTAVTLTAKYKSDGSTAAHFENRWMALTPIAIGG